MAKLEDEYNRQLDNSQTQISGAVERVRSSVHGLTGDSHEWLSQAMRVFNSPNILRSAVKASMVPLTTSPVRATPEFRQLPDGLVMDCLPPVMPCAP